jgi:hypothetical protein
MFLRPQPVPHIQGTVSQLQKGSCTKGAYLTENIECGTHSCHNNNGAQKRKSTGTQTANNGWRGNQYVRARTLNKAHNQVTVFAIESMWPTQSLTHIMGTICIFVSVWAECVRFVQMEPVQKLNANEIRPWKTRSPVGNSVWIEFTGRYFRVLLVTKVRGTVLMTPGPSHRTISEWVSSQ